MLSKLEIDWMWRMGKREESVMNLLDVWLEQLGGKHRDGMIR